MPLSVGTSGGNKLVAAMTVGTAGGNKDVLVGTVGTASGNKDFYVALAVSTQATRSGNAVAGPGVQITSNVASLTITGGSGSYAYLWSYVSGDSFTILTPTASTTQYRTSGVVPVSLSGTYICTVTDTVTGKVAVTNNQAVSMVAT